MVLGGVPRKLSCLSVTLLEDIIKTFTSHHIRFTVVNNNNLCSQ